MAHTLPSTATSPKLDTKPKVESKEKDLAPAIPKDPPKKGGTTYYHATTKANAIAIMSSHTLIGSPSEFGYVFAWKRIPSYALKNSGARSDATIFSFKTNTAFVRDEGIKDEKVRKYEPVVSFRPGPIEVWDIQIVRD